MSFNQCDKDVLTASLLNDSIKAFQFVSPIHQPKLELPEADDLSAFVAYYIYQKDVYEKFIPTDDGDSESSRVLRDFQFMVRYLGISKNAKEAFPLVKEFLSDYSEEYVRVARLVDYVCFVKSDAPLDPMVFKLRTGLNLYRLNFSLQDIANALNEC